MKFLLDSNVLGKICHPRKHGDARAGTPTGAEIGLDADMILAALALAEGAAIVTSNVRHLSRLVVAMDWMDVPLS